MNGGDRVGGKYRLLRQLGSGAMGVVWEAIQETTSRRVAIKLISQPSDDLRHRLLREARICCSIAHRNVIEVHDVGETEQGEPFLVMQLLSGETLADLLGRQRRLSPSMAAQIGRDVARGLAAAHAVNVIHRDLKPANIFLHHEAGTEGSIVKVLDFGVAKSLDANESLVTMVGGAVGSPAYMSPEQIRAARDLDHRTDVWALGVVLFEMLTGIRPFQGNRQELLTRVLVGPIPRASQFVRNLDSGLDDVVANCLERDRNKRVASASVVERLLAAYVAPEEGSRIHVGLAERAMALAEAEPGSAAAPMSVAFPTSAPSIREASSPAIETTMPLPASAMASAAGRVDMPGPFTPVATAPLPPMQPRSKQGTLIMDDVVRPRAVGPRGTALLGDVRQVLAQRGALAEPVSAMPTSGVTTTTSAVVQSRTPSTASSPVFVREDAHAGKNAPKKERMRATVMGASVLVVVAGGVLALGISRRNTGVVTNTTAAEAVNVPIEAAPQANPQPKEEPVVAPVPEASVMAESSAKPEPAPTTQPAGSPTPTTAFANPVPVAGTSRPPPAKPGGSMGEAKPAATAKKCKGIGLFRTCK
ncbi:protein kinase [Polyangium jinanense]|uniref:serine/threonine-protein kinase n=1 Tax=Polyangium jinanense TaxID=2829994 RepID=UPI002341427D|nr:serine/threonine-protein kinase [Polyangium jinanense]MDC3956932.1 protein kinase [Polyangium jinanense]